MDLNSDTRHQLLKRWLKQFPYLIDLDRDGKPQGLICPVCKHPTRYTCWSALTNDRYHGVACVVGETEQAIAVFESAVKK
jgi:hypothetical protein